MVIHVVFLLPLGYSVGTNSKQIFSLVFFFFIVAVFRLLQLVFLHPCCALVAFGPMVTCE